MRVFQLVSTEPWSTQSKKHKHSKKHERYQSLSAIFLFRQFCRRVWVDVFQISKKYTSTLAKRKWLFLHIKQRFRSPCTQHCNQTRAWTTSPPSSSTSSTLDEPCSATDPKFPRSTNCRLEMTTPTPWSYLNEKKQFSIWHHPFWQVQKNHLCGRGRFKSTIVHAPPPRSPPR